MSLTHAIRHGSPIIGLLFVATLLASRLGAQASDPPIAASPTVDVLADSARGIVGSKHDFSDAGRLPRDLCLPCHTPHISASEAPLLVASAAGRGSTRSYQTRVGELDAASLICLSCHDGTVASDVYAGPHALSWADAASAARPQGGSRLSSHPIGVMQPKNASGYHPPAAVTHDGRIKLPDGRIQCTSCHDPHNRERHAGMLVMSNARSRLCLSCHRL